MNENKDRPPHLAAWLARLCLHEVDGDVVLGDLEETYVALHRRYGPAAARRWYWSQVLRSVPQFFPRTCYWSFLMLKNYIKIAVRAMRRQKVYASINIFGLAVGIAFCALIFLFIRDELNYDQFHEEGDRIHRVLMVRYELDGGSSNGTNHSVPLGPTLQQDIPEIENYIRFRRTRHYVRTTGEALEETVLYADPSIFDVFSFPLVQGNPATVLSDLNAVVLSEEAARRYFGDEDPIGQTFQIRLEQSFEDFVVTGVAKNVPGNSTIRFTILLPLEKIISTRFRERRDSWSLVAFQTYVQLAQQADLDAVNEKMAAFFKTSHADYIAGLLERDGWAEGDTPATYRLQPLTSVYFTSYSDPVYSYILSGIALAILLSACINFMTLSIGRSAMRSKEVGVRKVVGAQRRQLVVQFWGEALMMSVCALLLGMILAELFLPIFNEFTNKELAFHYASDATTLAMLAGLVLLTGFIAGSYPALVLSRFKPIETLTNRLKLGGSNVFTKSLVVVQFGLSVFLILGTLIMARQLDYAQTRHPGYDKNHVVILPTSGMDGAMLSARFRQALGQHTAIEDITVTNSTMGSAYSSGHRFTYQGKVYDTNVFVVEANYLDFFGLELVQGRNFDPNLSTDTTEAILVNAALVRAFNMTDPLGKPIPGLPTEGGPTPLIAGVVKDYHFQTFYQEIAPAMLTLNPAWGYDYLMVRIQPTDISGTLALLRNTWQEIASDIPFEYSFLDEDMQGWYAADQRWSRIIRYAALFAVLIACLGLFGLATLTVTGRTKEIGIRKVLGAPVHGVVLLLSKDFVKLVLVGVVLAAPVAYFVMQRWLEQFAFRIDLSGWTFLLVGLLVLGVAFLTVSYQSIKAALADPVQSLRYE